jgi:hypothetical protein
MISKSRAKVSGCWSYFVEMYDLIASERSKLCVRRKGMGRMLLLADMLASYVDEGTHAEESEVKGRQ